MLAMTAARMRSCRSGGKGRRVSGPAADNADGALELDAVRVDACRRGGLADQGADGVMGEQVPVDLLADHVRALGPQYLAWPAQAGLELGIPGLMLPPLLVSLREDSGRGLPQVGDRGDQGDQLALAVAVAIGDLVFDHPDVASLVLVQVVPGPGGLDELLARLAAGLRVHQPRPVRPA